MAGQSAHIKFPARVGRNSPVSIARKVLRSNDPSVSREAVIHALRTLWRHRELDFTNESDVRLITRKLGVSDNFPMDSAKSLITIGNKRSGE